MHAGSSNIRVVVRLPYNRPEEPIPDPPRVEWNPEKEHILWEVIAKSRAVEGAGTDWKGLAAHLQVPLPYLLYRAQTRYEEDLRGLQGIRGTLSPTVTSPLAQLATPTIVTSKQPNGPASGGEYFPRFPTTGERPGIPRRDSLRTEGLGNGDLRSSIVSPTGRPLGVRARLSSLGSVQAQARSRRLSTISNTGGKKVMSSSTLTLQGPKKPREPIRPLSPTSSQPSPKDSTTPDASSEDENDLNDEQRQAEEQETLRLKLETLQKLMTADALGLVASSRTAGSRYSEKNKGKEKARGRDRPLSSSSSGQLPRHKLDMTRRYSKSQTPSHHSLSSVDATSPQGSIPSIPSPPPEPTRTSRPAHLRKPLSQPGQSTSPPALSPNLAWGKNATKKSHTAHVVSRTKVGGRVSERGSEMGSEASSFSDLSVGNDVPVDASLSAYASEMSIIRGASSAVSSFARSHLSQGIR